MKELISKNPILRFKLGKKILFAKEGTYKGIRVLLVSTSNGKEMYGYNDPATGRRTLIYGNLLDTKVGKGNANGKIYKGSDGKWYQNGKIITKFVSSAPKPIAKKVAAPISTPVDYGLVGGVLKGWKGLRGFIDDQSFADLQSLGYSGERNARAAQLWMNDNLSKYLVPGVVATDNAWGELSSRALKMMMLNKANLDLASIFTQNPVLFNSSNSTDKLTALNVGNNPNLKLTPITFNFNRALTRDWLRNNGIGPYSLTGAQRHAVRSILGGNGTDLDRSLIGTNSKLLELLTKRGYFKQGGLISRNPVLRFKNNINKN